MFKIVEFSHLLIKEYLNNSPLTYIRALDATCGNGNDTLFLAKLLDNKGTVDAYDIQEQAIINTKALLAKENITNVTLYHQSHEFIDPSLYDLVVFNLGYLPNADKKITTKHETTLKAVNLLTNQVLINPNLLIIICIYPGHEEGLLESKYLDNYVKELNSSNYLVTKFLNYNRPTSPYIITISKNKR